jgi:hypothetical protein
LPGAGSVRRPALPGFPTGNVVGHAESMPSRRPVTGNRLLGSHRDCPRGTDKPEASPSRDLNIAKAERSENRLFGRGLQD